MVAGLAVAIIATPTCKATRAAIERKEAKGESTVGNGRDAPVANGDFYCCGYGKIVAGTTMMSLTRPIVEHQDMVVKD